MVTDQQFDEFNAYWLAPEQEELRNSCAKGWAFQIWQASRLAIEIDLPTYTQYDGRDVCGASLAIADCREAIESVGLKVKS